MTIGACGFCSICNVEKSLKIRVGHRPSNPSKVVAINYSQTMKEMSWKSDTVCLQCNHVGYPVKKIRGHFAIELVLWLAFLVPGLIYTLWRLTTKYQACSVCGSPQLIPADSPRGRDLTDYQAPADSLTVRAGASLGRWIGRRIASRKQSVN